MGVQRQDGSIQSANTPTYNKLAKNRVERDYGIYRCMVTRVNFTDEETNLTFENKQVTYEAVILGGPKEGQVLQNIKAMNEFGGEYNYAEKIYRPLETKALNEKHIAEQKGDIIFVGFLQGNMRAPVIIGSGVQPLDKDKTGATKADGFRYRKEYNGVFQEINKTGEWELLRKGGELNDETGVLTPATGQEQAFEARLKFSENKMLWEDPHSSILFEKEEKKWTHKVGGTNYQEVIDGTAKKVNRTVGDITVEEDGAAKKMTATLGNVVMVLDGTGNKITMTAGSTILEIDGASGKISIKGDMVDVGKSVSDFAVLFTELSTAFNTHTHPFPYMAGPAPAAGVTQPPIAPLLASVGSTTVKLQP